MNPPGGVRNHEGYISARVLEHRRLLVETKIADSLWKTKLGHWCVWLIG